MADLVITAANVVSEADSNKKRGIAGETITAGQPLYKNSTDKKLYRAGANDTQAKSEAIGIALNNASLNQPIVYQSMGYVNVGATVAISEIYILSANVGGIAPEADSITGNYITILGVGTGINSICLAIHPSKVQVP